VDMNHPDVQDQIRALRSRLEVLDATPRPELSDEQIERERFQYESNAYALRTPMYAKARSIAVHFAIVPLEPLGTEPLVSPSKATQDPEQLLEYWAQFPDANIGVEVSRSNSLIAMRVEDKQAALRLRRLTAYELRDEDTGRVQQEHHFLDAAKLYLTRPESYTSAMIVDWEEKANRKFREMRQRSLPPETRWLLWSYPPIATGMDRWDFLARKVVTGVELLAPGTILPWAGSRLEGNLVLAVDSGPLPEIPTWLAERVGRKRSGRAIRAAREAWDAAMRASSGVSDAELLKLATLREQARAEAAAEAKKASAELARAEKAEPVEELPPVLSEEESGWE
jgi:hypothetical protein